MTRLRLQARWVVPVASAPIDNGAVVLDGATITAVGRAAGVPQPGGARTLDLGDVVLLPGLVNTHAHLELTCLAGQVKDLPFRDWILRVRALRDELSEDALRRSADDGVRAHFAAGITTIGDTGSTRVAAGAMHRLGARGIAYQEVFGPDPSQCAASLAGLEDDLARQAGAQSARVTVAVSPHAPYTVSGELLAAVVRLATERELPMAMHLAESPEETAFVRDGAGPFADGWRRRGITVTARRTSPVRWAAQYGLLHPRALLIHCVQAGRDDIAAIALAGAAVAHCPHSNRELGHGRADLAGMLAAGVRVGLGTDSVATGAPVDLFREARLARDGAGLSPEATIRLMTEGGARALGMGGIGRLEAGAAADLAAIQTGGSRDPYEGVLGAALADVRATWASGALVHDALS